MDPDAVLFELLATPEGRAEPYSRYRALLDGPRVHHSALGPYVLTRYDDCQALLRDNRFGKDQDGIPMRPGISEAELAELAAMERDRATTMLFLNPPDHTRLRGLVSKAFTPRTVERLRPHIEGLVDELLADMEGEVDVMTALAFPLPAAVISEMLGVPRADAGQFQHLVRTATASLEMTATIAEIRAAAEAFDVMEAYFRDLVAERRRDPQPDLLSELIRAEDEGDRLTESELISTAILLYAAGFETTTNLIGNGLLALLRHPDELQRLRDDRSLLRTAVEELLRWDSPVQLDGRTAFEDVEVAGTTIPAGGVALTLLGAANFDPEHWKEPERFDIGRDEGPPLSFASGIHFCLGASLARAEGQVVMDRLLDTYRSIELRTDEPEWRGSLTLRGLASLPVALAREQPR